MSPRVLHTAPRSHRRHPRRQLRPQGAVSMLPRTRSTRSRRGEVVSYLNTRATLAILHHMGFRPSACWFFIFAFCFLFLFFRFAFFFFAVCCVVLFFSFDFCHFLFCFLFTCFWCFVFLFFFLPWNQWLNCSSQLQECGNQCINPIDQP